MARTRTDSISVEARRHTRNGTNARGLVKRVGFFVSGVIYSGLALFAVKLKRINP